MKISPNKIILAVLVLLATTLLSWNGFNNPKPIYKTSSDQMSEFDYSQLQEQNEIDAYNANYDYDFGVIVPNLNSRVPPAEDVLVQKIQGDNSHLLMMAYYPKERYPGHFVTIKQFGTNIDFRDDGLGDDKKAGDGLFTGKIYADVNDFRKTAVNMDEEMKKSGQKQFRFVHRAMTYNPDELESFDVKKLDNYSPVSVTSLSQAGITKIDDSVRKSCIFITDLKVVEDPARTWNPCTQTGNVNGPWTMKTLLKELAKKTPASVITDSALSDFVKNSWFANYQKRKIINSDTVKARKLVNDKILDPWIAKSEAAGGRPGQLDFRFCPFKLTGIANRFDLRERFSTIAAGEGRYTFNLINSSCTDKEDFTVVIEYAVNYPDICDTLRTWAQKWYDLKNYEMGSSAYNAALNKITDYFSYCGSTPSKINQSSLQTLRTNDRALSPNPIICEFREFILGLTSNVLFQREVTHHPADIYNAKVDNAATRRLANWANSNSANINADVYQVPSFWQDSPFRAGKVQILGPTTGSNLPNVYYWDATSDKNGLAYITNNTTRQVFSLNTCTGCHSGETQTNFTHVDPVFFGTQATLSGFLTGKPGQGGSYDWDLNPNNDSILIKDPALRPTPNPKLRGFNDILRRARDLKDYATTPCGSVLAIRNELMFNSGVAVH